MTEEELEAKEKERKRERERERELMGFAFDNDKERENMEEYERDDESDDDEYASLIDRMQDSEDGSYREGEGGGGEGVGEGGNGGAGEAVLREQEGENNTLPTTTQENIISDITNNENSNNESGTITSNCSSDENKIKFD
jgi:hypothetical protein